jgi:hypothetical protein
MNPWTPQDREDFVSTAKNSEFLKGNRGPYHYNVYQPVVMNEQEDIRKTYVTEALAKVLYGGKPEYRKISLKFYDTLMTKLSSHFATAPFMNTMIRLLIKGGNAYTYLVSPEDLEKFPYSDLDIVISINPKIDEELFEYINTNVRTIVLQSISQYKRMLDHLLFINQDINDPILSDEEISEFKKDLISEFEKIPADSESCFLTPFESVETRNNSSRYSFMLTHSDVHENCTVKIDLPHFDKCECIPMRKTPLFCSYNETINFKRDNDTMDGHFDLYRIRFNCLFVEDGGRYEKITADFIDVTIAAKDDAELLDFWDNGKHMTILDQPTGIWVNVPTIETCINDLYKMLNVYACPEGKRAKREVKYALLKKIAGL